MTAFDIDTYLARIGLGIIPDTDAVGLAIVQRAHRLAIPFENFDIHLGRGINIAPDHVFEKLVRQRRGGYCFEHNQVFMSALLHLGFNARPLLARSWLVTTPGVIPARTHIFSLVDLGGQLWVADAGFGGGYAPPMLLIADAIVTGPDGVQHRFIEDADLGWILERNAGTQWSRQYSFTTQKVEPSDIAVSNHWTATSPDSRFVKHRIAAIVLPQGAASLQDRAYSRTNQRERVASDITSNRMLQMRLSLMFGIDLDMAEVERLNLF